jgi:hypothetical protein
MARANRHILSGQIWHLTHRCHQRQFLLKFACDRQAWIEISTTQYLSLVRAHASQRMLAEMEGSKPDEVVG